MSRFTEVEIQYDDHTVLVGSVRMDVDGKLELDDDFSVIVYIGNIDHDITKALNSKRLEAFKTSFMLAVYDKGVLMDDLRFSRADVEREDIA